MERTTVLTLAELRALIAEEVDRRLQTQLHPPDPRPVQEINATIRRWRWTPPPDAPSSLMLLREDRDA